MNKQLEVVFGLVILILIIGGFGYGILWTRPTDSEVLAKRTVKTIVAPKNVLQLDVAKRISELEVNGAVPVTVSPEEIGRPNPFLPY